LSDKPDLPELICSVCEAEPALGVAAVPGVPFSVAYGRACIDANAHPYGILVGNTAAMVSEVDMAVGVGVLIPTADWWQKMVLDTLAHLDIAPEQFDADVRTAARDMATYRE
jgi:hypothetical protein